MPPKESSPITIDFLLGLDKIFDPNSERFMEIQDFYLNTVEKLYLYCMHVLIESKTDDGVLSAIATTNKIKEIKKGLKGLDRIHAEMRQRLLWYKEWEPWFRERHPEFFEDDGGTHQLLKRD